MQAGLEKIEHRCYLQPGRIAKSEQKRAEIRGRLSVDLTGHYNYGAEYFLSAFKIVTCIISYYEI